MCPYYSIPFMAMAAANICTATSFASSHCASAAQSKCLSQYNATILNTTYYGTGTYNASGIVNEIPFCEVSASVSYGTNDTLLFSLWLPDEKDYTSRFMAIGNGGFAGFLIYDDMLDELNNGLGFAVASSDGGHSGAANDVGAGQGLGVPGKYIPFLHDKDQVEAWLHDSIKIFTPAAKALIKVFYGKRVERSYYRGCSAGGAQGFSLAEFYPDLFDGVIAGCSANGFTHLLLAFLWSAQHTSTEETTLPDYLINYIQASVIKQCDLIDGVKDNLVENPLACPFDISTLACKAGIASTEEAPCLTPAQVSTVKALYQGPVRSDSPSTHIFPGLALGSEAGWSLPQVSGALSNAFSVPMMQNLVYNNLSYDPATFNWGSDVDFLDKVSGPLINSTSTDLSSFRKAGGKMIVYAGWADPNIAPMWSMEHVEAITHDTIGSATTIAENDFIKLVMVPGGGHCGSGNAKYPYVPAHYKLSSGLVEWVEKDKEPVDGFESWGPPNGDKRTRKLCTWPKTAKLKKGGDADDWKSYICA